MSDALGFLLLWSALLVVPMACVLIAGLWDWNE